MKSTSARARKRRSNVRLSENASLTEKLSSMTNDAWWWSGTAILLAATLLRLLFLTVKPLHHDEGVNGLFLANLFRSSYYHYDPSNFHGPSLYYLALIPTAINNLFHWGHGLSTFGIRFVTAFFGVATVWLMLCLRRYLGTPAALAAALFATVSPGFVFFSRYFIHEILFIFFSLGVIVAWLRYRDDGKPLYLYLASASAAMLFATKETWLITAVVWLIALPCTTIYLRLRGRKDLLPQPQEKQPANKKRLLIASGIFVAIGVLLYSSFFTNPQGILDSILTFTYWTKTGEHGIYNKPWSTYFEWMWAEESPLLILGGLGVLTAFIRARSYFTVFCAFWTIGIIAAYSLVPYKTPWLVLSLLLPLTVMAGYLVGVAYQPGLRALISVITCMAIAGSLYQAIDVSFFNYDDDSYIYVYAHTNRDFLKMVDEIDAIMAKNPAHQAIGITVMSPEHWPLPWYLRDDPNAGYWGKIVPTTQPIVIAREDQLKAVEQQLGNNYVLFSTHELRPGVTLELFVRKDGLP